MENLFVFLDMLQISWFYSANKERVTDQLKLALAWNRIDVAESDIFTEDKRWEVQTLDQLLHCI